MPHHFTRSQISDLEAVLSAPRFATYLRAAGGDRHRAMALYCWNTEISAAFFVMLQYCELSIRNGALEAVERAFGENWHQNRGFVYTLPLHKKGYQPRSDLTDCAAKLPTLGKVVAELKFAFWENLFVKGQQDRLWTKYLAVAFPGYDRSLTVAQTRTKLYNDIVEVRKFRNRIAHHEPIFSRQLSEDRDRIRRIVAWRRPGAALWLDGIESVSSLLLHRP